MLELSSMSLTNREMRELVSLPNNIAEASAVIAWLQFLTDGSEKMEADTTVSDEKIDGMRAYFKDKFEDQKEQILLEFIEKVTNTLRNAGEELHITQRLQMEVSLERAINQAYKWQMWDNSVSEASKILRSSQQVVQKP